MRPSFFGIFDHSIYHTSSTQAAAINKLAVHFYWGAGLVLLVVIGLTAYMLFKFRHREGKAGTNKQVHKKWEIAMVGIPCLLVSFFFYRTIVTMNEVLPSAEGKTPDVIITGHQWWWQADYPAKQVSAANEIHVPAGKKLLFRLLSADVIHSWWIPELGNKMDVVPGRENHLWLTINKPGTYLGSCSEFCGHQHANMHIRLIAQNQQDYEAWISAQQQQPALAPNDSLILAGAHVFSNLTCGDCHRLQGAGANGTTGPDLTHIGSRKTLLTGVLENNPDNLKAWLRHPQQIKPGAYMPDFYLKEPELTALAAYLSSLK